MRIRELKLTDGAIEGSDRLRDAIAGLYGTIGREDVLVTHGAIGANHLVYEALVEPGDRVVLIVPTYQQHVSIPGSLGAEVVVLPLREADGWRADLDELMRLAADGAKLIALTNPSNPTGALLDADDLRQIAPIANAAGAWVLCDEVYRGIDRAGTGTTASIADLCPRGISVGSMSKAFSLAGLRDAAPVRARPGLRDAVRPAGRGARRHVHPRQRPGRGGVPADRLRQPSGRAGGRTGGDIGVPRRTGGDQPVTSR